MAQAIDDGELQGADDFHRGVDGAEGSHEGQ